MEGRQEECDGWVGCLLWECRGRVGGGWLSRLSGGWGAFHSKRQSAAANQLVIEGATVDQKLLDTRTPIGIARSFMSR